MHLKKLYPKNTPSHFINQLPNYKEFPGNCVIGLKEIHFPLTFKKPEKMDENQNTYITINPDTENSEVSNDNQNTNINKNNENKILSRSTRSAVAVNTVPDHSIVSSLATGDAELHYRNIITQQRNQFLASYEDLQKQIRDCRSSLRQSELLTECGDIISNHFTKMISDLNSQSNHLSIYAASLEQLIYSQQDNLDQKEVFLQIKSQIEEVSHMRDHLIVEFLDYMKVLKSENKIEVDKIKESLTQSRDFWKNSFVGLSYSAFTNTQEKNEPYIPKYLFIYCNLAENRNVGDTMAPLLNIIRVPPIRMNGQTGMERFDFPDFYKLNISSFDSIEINIRDGKGQLISFDKGKVFITLEIREKEKTHNA